MYDLYLYEDKKLDLNLSIKIEKTDPQRKEKRVKLVEFMEQAIKDIKKDIDK